MKSKRRTGNSEEGTDRLSGRGSRSSGAVVPLASPPNPTPLRRRRLGKVRLRRPQQRQNFLKTNLILYSHGYMLTGYILFGTALMIKKYLYFGLVTDEPDQILLSKCSTGPTFRSAI